MNGHSKSKRLERDLREGLINISYVTDLGRGHSLSTAFFSGPIKHQTEKCGPHGARKTGYLKVFFHRKGLGHDFYFIIAGQDLEVKKTRKNEKKARFSVIFTSFRKIFLQ